MATNITPGGNTALKTMFALLPKLSKEELYMFMAYAADQASGRIMLAGDGCVIVNADMPSAAPLVQSLLR